METHTQLLHLTEEQLAIWRERVHQEYLAALAAQDRVLRRERLLRRYILRHTTNQANRA